ncbi:EipB family protein [Aureimonas mangrovi]|uniref:EipB family protein n=1 Tax=Aureimonas mangrovi TaxID=2758041 RepID=UPI00163D9E88|nr:DUF1849 family protein [Aureimonas mangrovi]
MRLSRLCCILAAAGAAAPAGAATLGPHRAVYDLSLASQTQDIVSAEGRIAFDLTMPECGVYALDYRFVARFGQESETTLTDQRVVTREGTDGRSFEFEAWTYVDGMQQAHVKGSASSEGEVTTVETELPGERSFDLPLSQFPLGHTAALIEAAQGGERIAQLALFDGDEDAEKLLTTTSILLPVGSGTQKNGPVGEGLAGMDSWKVDESYFNSDSDADGLPIFHTRYTLFENGVSDDIFMDFGDYALQGSLSELTLGSAPADCES